MVARGDLGVEVPIEEIAILQKQLIAKASLAGQAGHHRHADARVDDDQPPAHARRGHRRGQRHPRRHRLHHALRRVGDGQVSRGSRGDAGEDRGLRRGAPRRPRGSAICTRCPAQRPPATAAEAIAAVVEHALDTVPCAAVFVPTRTGTTARMISRFNPPCGLSPLSRAIRPSARDWRFPTACIAVELRGADRLAQPVAGCRRGSGSPPTV